MSKKCIQCAFILLIVSMLIYGIWGRGETKDYVSQAYASTLSHTADTSFAEYIERRTTNRPDTLQLMTKYQRCNNMLKLSHCLSFVCFGGAILLLFVGLFLNRKFLNFSFAFFLMFAVMYFGSSCVHGLTIRNIRDHVSDRTWYMEFVQEE